jgi:PKD repeat protein
MRNKILFFLITCFLFSSNISLGQCPAPVANYPDSACSGVPILFSNTTVGSNLISEWDFNTSENYNNPVGSLVLNNPANLVSSLGLDLVFDNSQYYAFSINTSGNLTRFDFGNSYENNPTINALGNLGILSNCGDIRILSNNGNWFGFINTFSNQVIRLNFGNNLINIPTATALNLSASLFSTPYYIDIEKIGNNFIGIISNYSGGNITVIDFGNDLQNNNPNGFNISVPFSNPISAAITMDCGEIYAIVGYASGYSPVLINFGTTVSATPNSITPLNSSLAMSYRKIDLICNDTSYLVFGQTFNGESVYLMDFGKHINNLNPAISNLGNMNVLSSGFFTNSIKKIGSSLVGFSTGYYNGDLVKFKFKESKFENSFIDNNNNVSVKFDSTGYHYFSLTVKDTISGLSNTISDSIYINNNPSANIQYSSVCQNAPVVFNYQMNNGSSITQSDWIFSNGFSYSGDTANYTFTNPGDYNITLNLIASTGCTTSITSPISIKENPTANFSFIDSVCSGTDILFSDSSLSMDGSITNWSWNINNSTYNSTNCNHQFLNGGLFPITLTIETNYTCKDSTTKDINILSTPIADFETMNTCIGEITLFINTTDSNSLPSVNYFWNLGNNQTTSLTNPTFQYPLATANYNVELIASSLNGCSDTIQKTTRVGNVPQPQFTISSDTICQNSLIQITDNSQSGIGEIISGRIWDLGDGTIIHDSIFINHAYSNPGQYQITLKVISPTSCDSSLIKSIYVIESPIAQFSTSNVCLGDTNVFTDQSSTPPGSVITNWLYQFGDNTQSSLSNTFHKYASSGSYNAYLIVTSNIGCSDTSSTIAINVLSLPMANFSYSKACTGQPVQFTDSSSSTRIIQDWKWNFGNNLGTSNNQNPSFAFNNNFAYPVKLICIDSKGCSDTIIKFIIVDKTPDFNINFNNNCEGLTTQFGFVLNSSASTNFAYLWSFGDSTSSFQSNPQHLYSTSGLYSINLETTDLSNGCALTLNDTIDIYPNPISNFQNKTGCIGKDISLIDSSFISSGTIQSTFWNINNNYFFTGDSISFNASTSGNYSVSLLSTSFEGCKDSITKNIIIYPNPNVSFSTSSIFGAPPLSIDFTTNSSQESYTWDFGDGTTYSNQANPNHIFYDTGIYSVNLIASTSYGCIDSNSIIINVFNPINDVAVIGNTIIKDNNKWNLKALFKNEGNLPINTLEIKLSVEGRSSFYESIAGLNIEPGNIYEYTFKSSLDASEISPSYFCTEALLVNDAEDELIENNNFCSTITDQFKCYNLYPNPATDGITFGVTLPKDEKISVQILSVSGDNCLRSYSYNLKKGYSTIYLNLNQPVNLSSGLYLLIVRYKEESNTIKLVKY